MDFRMSAREFLGRSREELRRLESEMQAIREIIGGLEALLQNKTDQESSGEEGSAAPFSAPPSPSPSSGMLPGKSAREGLIPVGELAEALLREKGEAMSLEALYLAIKGRPDVVFSRDLKNAIRVALIRRRPRVVSERRGWFRFAGEASAPRETETS